MNIIRTNIHHETTVKRFPGVKPTPESTAELIQRMNEATKRYIEKYGKSPFAGDKSVK